ncbi:MAG: 50S ribosomal protein L6 [Bacteroidales bacterium]
MSRIGKLPIEIPQGVKVSLSSENVLTAKGPVGELHQKIDSDIKVNISDNTITFERPTDQKRHKAMHGLYRALVNNMITGVSKGFEIKQELVGVGYRAANTGQVLEIAVGYSHVIYLELPSEVKVEASTERRANPVITLKSADKQLLGQVAAKIRSFRSPEPYKGKGIKFVDEQLRRKAGKAAAGS